MNMPESQLDAAERYQVLLAAIQAIALLPEAHPGTGAEAIRIARIAMAAAETSATTLRPNQLH